MRDTPACRAPTAHSTVPGALLRRDPVPDHAVHARADLVADPGQHPHLDVGRRGQPVQLDQRREASEQVGHEPRPLHRDRGVDLAREVQPGERAVAASDRDGAVDDHDAVHQPRALAREPVRHHAAVGVADDEHLLGPPGPQPHDDAREERDVVDVRARGRPAARPGVPRRPRAEPGRHHHGGVELGGERVRAELVPQGVGAAGVPVEGEDHGAAHRVPADDVQRALGRRDVGDHRVRLEDAGR